MTGRGSVGWFVVAGLLVVLGLAFLVSPLASSEPDGLERVAIDQGFDGRAVDHALGSGPLAGYGVAGVDSEWLSTGLSGVVGVLLCFVLAGAVLLVVRWSGSRRYRAGAAGGVAGSSGSDLVS